MLADVASREELLKLYNFVPKILPGIDSIFKALVLLLKRVGAYIDEQRLGNRFSYMRKNFHPTLLHIGEEERLE